jgi:hypothetical protein
MFSRLLYLPAHDGMHMSIGLSGTPGSDKMKIWFTGRAHPGETYSSYWIEGMVDILLDDKDAASQALLQQAVVYVVSTWAQTFFSLCQRG